jgi:hypothetical protein
LESAIKVHGLQLALSVWNVYEIGRAADRAQQDRRLAFLHSLDPIWMIERRPVQLHGFCAGIILDGCPAR